MVTVLERFHCIQPSLPLLPPSLPLSSDISSPPQNVSVKVIDHHQLRVTWTPPPPSELSGVFEGYHITLTEVTTGSMWTISIIDDVTHYTITDLHPNYMYQVELAINTNQGLGLFSRTLSATTSPYCKEE